MLIQKGTTIGYLAPSTENGGYNPHSHMLIRSSAYDGVGTYAGCSNILDAMGKMVAIWYYGGYAYDCWSSVEPDLYDPFNFVCTALVGTYAEDRLDSVSDRFRAGYQRWGASLGCPTSNYSGTEFVHDVFGVVLQDFYQSDTNHRFAGSDGWTALIYNPGGLQTHLIRSGFWGTYKCLQVDGHFVGGATLLGAPTDEEHLGMSAESERDWLTRVAIAIVPGATTGLAALLAASPHRRRAREEELLSQSHNQVYTTRLCRTTCHACGGCDGARPHDIRQNVAVIAHGAGASSFHRHRLAIIA